VVQRLFIIVSGVVVLGAASVSQGETVFVRGRRGPIVPNNSGRMVIGKTFRGAPNLVFMNGGIFERTSQGVRGLKIDMRTGKLLGARSPQTVSQLARLFMKNLNRFQGRAREAITRFLRANLGSLIAADPRPRPSARSPKTTASADGPAQTAQRTGLDQDSGKHGQGSAVDTTPKPRGAGSSARPVASDGASGEAAAGVCRDLHSTLCNSSQAQNAVRRAEEAKQDTVLGFMRLARIDGRSFGSILGGILREPGRFGAAYSAFTSFLSGRLGSEAKTALSSARSALLTSIESQPISAQSKEALRTKLASVRFRFTPNFASGRSLQAFVENCGPEGMADGAFAIPDLNEVVICPGLVFGAKAKGGSLESHLTHVIAHEMGHHCGADHTPRSLTGFGAFKSLYRNMEACYQDEFPNLGEERMGEVVADNWGVEALAVQIRGKSRSEALDFLRNAMAPLCSTDASEVHPPGSFRLNVTLGRNPRIREALGCGDPTPERPACTMAGTVPEQ
jgi:hypothetical protein